MSTNGQQPIKRNAGLISPEQLAERYPAQRKYVTVPDLRMAYADGFHASEAEIVGLKETVDNLQSEVVIKDARIAELEGIIARLDSLDPQAAMAKACGQSALFKLVETEPDQSQSAVERTEAMII